MPKSLIGKKTAEDAVENMFGMSEEEAAALEAEEAAAEGETDEEKIIREEEEEAERLAGLSDEEIEAERVAGLTDEEVAEEERVAGLTDEEREAEEKEKGDENDDDDFSFGGDSDDDDKKKEKKKDNTPITEEAFLKFATEKLGREVKSLDDLTITTKAEFANEQLETLNNFVKDTDRDVHDWFKMEQLNTEGMTNEQLVKAQLSIKYPNLGQSAINRKFSRTYKLNPENDTEQEILDATDDLEIDAGIAKVDINKLTDGYKMPIKEVKKVDNAIEERKAQQVKADFVTKMVKVVDSIDAFNFEIGDKDNTTKVRYKPSRADRKQMKNANQNLETFIDQYRNADGSLNTDELSRGLWLGTRGNVEKLLTGTMNRFKTEGKGGQIKKQKNTKLPKKDGNKGDKSDPNKKDRENMHDIIEKETKSGNMGMKIQF